MLHIDEITETDKKEFREILTTASLPSHISEAFQLATFKSLYPTLQESFLNFREAHAALLFISTRHPNSVIRSIAEERLMELDISDPQNQSKRPMFEDRGSLITFKRVLRELTRNSGRKFGFRGLAKAQGALTAIPYRESNFFLKAIYEHEPLIKLTQPEKALSRLLARQSFKSHMNFNLGHADSETWSWEQWSQKSKNELVDPKQALLRPELLHLMDRSAALFKHYGSRTLQGYVEETSIDILALAKSQIEKKQKAISVLDVGSYRCEALYGLKMQLRDQVETHAVSMHVVPRYHSDYFWCCSADYLPDKFRQKFDLITSSRCLEYVALGHRALEGIAESLSIEGVACLQWRSGRALLDGANQRANNLIALVTPDKPSEKVILLISAGSCIYAKNAQFNRIAASQLEWTRERIAKSEEFGIESRLSIAWCESVVKLAKDNRFELKILSYTITGIGAVPGRIQLRRLSD